MSRWWPEISIPEKDAFIDLTRECTGLVFLHHSLVSYQTWDTFKFIIGGKYFHDNFTGGQKKNTQPINMM